MKLRKLTLKIGRPFMCTLTAGKDLAMPDCKRVTDGRLSLVVSKPGSVPRVVVTEKEL